MKLNNYILIYGLVLMLFAGSCNTYDEIVEARKEAFPISETEYGESGNADFSNFIAIGNSLTAGYMDGALYNHGQENSFPKLIANRLNVDGIGAGEFNQPDINSENGFNPSFSVLPDQIFGRTELSLSKLAPVPTVGELITAYTGDKSALGNFGVPGAKLTDLRSPALFNNGYYARFATNPGVSTLLGDALATAPTFYSLWIGNNDILGYALAGADDNISSFTDQATFQTELTAVLSELMGSGAKGVIINIPPVLFAPYFQAVPHNPVPLDKATADLLNSNFEGVNLVVIAALNNKVISFEEAVERQILFSESSNNSLLINDENLTDLGPFWDMLVQLEQISQQERDALEPYRQSRQADETDLVPLSTAPQIGKELGSPTALHGITVPLADKYILTFEEQSSIYYTIGVYNAVIEGVVSALNTTAGNKMVAIHDIRPMFADMAGLDAGTANALGLGASAAEAADMLLGIEYQGFNYAPDFGPNGLFSTDGIHPNPKGHAIIADQIIKTINTEYSSSIPAINISPFRTVVLTE